MSYASFQAHQPDKTAEEFGLGDVDYGSMQQAPMSDAVQNAAQSEVVGLLAKSAIENATNQGVAALREQAGSKIKEISQWVKRGDKTLNTLCILGGAALVAAGFLGLLNFLNPLALVVNFYNCVFGLVIIILELQYHSLGRNCLSSPRKYVEENVKFLSTSGGRGMFYLYVGSVNLAMWTFFGFLIGGAMCGLGVMSVVVACHTRSKLVKAQNKLKELIGASQGDIKAKFQEFDTNHNGTIDVTELQDLCASLGAPLQGKAEVNAALNSLDSDRSGEIDLHEFTEWFTHNISRVI